MKIKLTTHSALHVFLDLDQFAKDNGFKNFDKYLDDLSNYISIDFMRSFTKLMKVEQEISLLPEDKDIPAKLFKRLELERKNLLKEIVYELIEKISKDI